MTRPTLEVADILRAHGDRFLDRYRTSFDFQQLKAFRAIQRCRTAALGGHRDACPGCGYQTISYNSCRNRHCPKCQASSSATEQRVGTRDLHSEDACLWHCPRCGASMIVIQRFTAEELSECTYFDSS